VYMVVSSATTGFFACRASRTSSETRKKPLLVRWRLPSAVQLWGGRRGRGAARERSLMAGLVSILYPMLCGESTRR
jgi:hypothetical protein